jgi:hypothetical protein
MGNQPLDAVTVEVVRAALNAAAERMRITMIKTAYNHIISESLDFGCAIFDADVQMVAQGIGLPVFQGHLGFPIQATVADRGLEAFREGDVFIHNDPYAGNGNHLNDVAMYAPVFWEGQLTGFVSVKAHWSDVGGPVPSSMQVGSREFRQEGLRFQSVRLFDRGVLNEEVMRLIHANIRVESGTPKDIQAMIAVCRAGETYVKEILAKYGRDLVLESTRVYLEQSERRTRAELARIPAGTYRAVAHFDNDGITLDQPVRVEMAITLGRRDHDGGLHRVEPAGGGAVQLRRRHHDQRLPAPHQVPVDAAHPGGRGLLPAPASHHPEALGAGLRGAGPHRALLRADQPAHRPRAARAGGGDPGPDPGRLLRRPDADDRLRHASGDRAPLHPGRPERGGYRRAAELRRRVRDDHLRGVHRAQQPGGGGGVPGPGHPHPRVRAPDRLGGGGDASAGASASSASTSSSRPRSSPSAWSAR